MALASQVLWDLTRYLQEQTGEGGPYALPPTGVLWTPIAPVPSVGEALGRALKAEKSHIGVLMPTSDRRLEAVRSPYPDAKSEARHGGAIREMTGYLTVFIRSGRGMPLDGAFADLPNWLERVLRDYKNPAVHDTVRVEDTRMYGAHPDYLILESGFSFKYLVEPKEEEGIPLRGFRLYGGFHQHYDDPGQPGPDPTRFWFSVYLGQ